MLTSLLVSLGLSISGAFVRRSLIHRAICLKLACDFLAVIVLVLFPESHQEGLKSLTILVILTGVIIIFLLLLWSLRYHEEENTLRVERQ